MREKEKKKKVYKLKLAKQPAKQLIEIAVADLRGWQGR